MGLSIILGIAVVLLALSGNWGPALVVLLVGAIAVNRIARRT